MRIQIDAQAERIIKKYIEESNPSTSPGNLISRLVMAIGSQPGLMGQLLDPFAATQAGEFKTDEVQAYAQQVWYCLQRGAWYEALELAEYALKSCDLAGRHYSYESLALGVAFSKLNAAFEVEIEAYIAKDPERLALAIVAVDQVISQLSEHIKSTKIDLGKSANKSPHSMRVVYALACAKAMKLRMCIERDDANFPRFAFDAESTNRRNAFMHAWHENLPYTEKELHEHKEYEGLRALAAEALKSVDRCLHTAFMRAHARIDPDLLALATIEPWKADFDVSTEDDQSHYEDLKAVLGCN